MSGHDPSETVPARRPEILESMERQLAVLALFDAEHPSLTLSEVAALTDTTRPTARRILLTLKQLGYVRVDGRQYSLTPKVLDFGWSYFASLSLEDSVRPILDDLRTEIDESCSIGQLDGANVVMIARSYTRRVTTLRGRVGDRQPAHATALGQAILATLSDAELEDWLERNTLTTYTDSTLTDPERFTDRMRLTRDRGWSLVEGELEEGLRAIGAPVLGTDDDVVAAITISTMATRTKVTDMRDYVETLLHTARLLSPVFRLSHD